MINEECYDYLRGIKEHVEHSEELLKILVANELLDEVEVNLKCDNSINEYEKMCRRKQIVIQKKEKFYNKTLLYLQSEKGWTIKFLQEVKTEINRMDEKIIPVFIFKRFRGTQKST